jgi:uncharacterized protein (UPF0264 family)
MKPRSESSLKVLISPKDEQEAQEAIDGGADIIDIKNPAEGALGAGFPWVIRRVRELAPFDREVSCTIGDLPNLPGSAALAAYGAAACGVNYVKASLFGLKNRDDAVTLLKAVVKAAKAQNPKVKVVAAGFADAERIGSILPSDVPKVAFEGGCDVALLDTAVKDGQTLLDFLTKTQLTTFVSQVHSYSLKAALAGSLKKEQLPAVCSVCPDMIGLRSAACEGGDRISGHITRQKVAEIVQIVRNAEKCAPKA